MFHHYIPIGLWIDLIILNMNTSNLFSIIIVLFLGTITT